MVSDDSAPTEPYEDAEAGTSNGEDEEEITEELKIGAETTAHKIASGMHDQATVSAVDFLAQGGYNNVWVVTYDLPQRRGNKLILRTCRESAASLKHHQVRNEVRCLKYVASHVPGIPVPKLYAWDDGTTGSGPAFTAEEYIEGQRLSVAWPQLTEDQKSDLCRQIAEVVARLGETRFEKIGGLMPDLSFGPTVEAGKVFNGRPKFHSKECYNIGPYANSKEYILACYDREIYFYTHADPTDIEDFFETTSVTEYIDHLKRRKQELAADTSGIFAKIDAEPLVLVHEDFHAGNFLVREGNLVAVLDWEFAGVYPLSELMGAAQIVQASIPLEDRDEETEAEEDRWDARYRCEVGEVVKRRGWREEDVGSLLGGGFGVLRGARMIMFPSD